MKKEQEYSTQEEFLASIATRTVVILILLSIVFIKTGSSVALGLN